MSAIPESPRCAPPVAAAASAPLRVASYNLMDGGTQDWPAQLELLASLEADLLGVQEAKHWERSDHARLHEAVEALGMQPLFAPSHSHGCHLVLFYRWPRVRCRGFRPDISCGRFHHTAARAQFTVDGLDERLRVLHWHGHPFSPTGRVTEAGWLTEYADPDHLTLLIGDLNTGGLTGVGADREPDWDQVPRHLHSRHRLLLPDGTYGASDRRAMSALANAGFIDPPQQLGMVPPRTAGHWGRGSEPFDRRSDYVLLSRRLAPALQDHRVVDTADSRRLSDHLPVVTSVDLTRLGR
ncbi:endonuclease/exonuclease/phosphatase family protein [Streptomyces californicus]|uniref:endonuclease/exonuclease/phosphatase family protein n=1 Tax=Streptomyces californicus TaxID=67351 RepID=UPI00371DD488